MKVRLVVGPVEIRASGLDLTERQVRRLLEDAGRIATALLSDDEEAEPERAPMGFTAQVERAGELAPESFFSDDSE